VNFEGEKLIIERGLKAEGFSSVRIADRKIDGVPAVLVTGKRPETYWSDQYQQNGETFGRAVCKVNSGRSVSLIPFRYLRLKVPKRGMRSKRGL